MADINKIVVNDKTYYIEDAVARDNTQKNAEQIAKNSKRIKNIEAGVPSENFVTDSAVALTKHVPDNALPSAMVEKVGGMTYDDGTVPELKNSKVTALKIIGANLFNDEEWFAQHGFSKESGGYWNCKSKNEICFTNITRRSGSMYINVVAKSDLSPHDSVMYIRVEYTDGSAQVGCDVTPSADFVNISMITDAAKTVDYVLWTYGTGGEYRLKGVSISFAETSEYIPYTETYFPIPAEVQALDGYGEGLSADCCNYIDLYKKQFIKRVGKIDLGTLDWNLENGFLSSSELPFESVIRSQGKCVAYTVVQKDYRNIENGEMIVNCPAYSSRSRVYVQDNSYVDDHGGTFKENISGVMLYYELASPEIVDISELISDDNYIIVEGDGLIIVVNEHGYAVPTEIIYQIKGAAA